MNVSSVTQVTHFFCMPYVCQNNGYMENISLKKNISMLNLISALLECLPDFGLDS